VAKSGKIFSGRPQFLDAVTSVHLGRRPSESFFLCFNGERRPELITLLIQKDLDPFNHKKNSKIVK